MDLKALRTFMSVADGGSLSKASARLRLAQPALSRHIKLLEDEIGARLFERSARGMQLTHAGSELLRRISGPVRQIDQSVAEVRSIAAEVAGHVALGVMSSVSGVLPGRVVERAADELPDVSLRIVEESSDRLADWLQRGDVDLTLLYGPTADSRFLITPLFTEALLLIGSADSLLRPNKPIRFSELAKIDLALTSRTRGVRLILERAAARSKLNLRVRYEVDSSPVLKDLVRLGLGYTVLPWSAFSTAERNGLFTVAPIVRPRMSREIVLALPADRPVTRAAQSIADLITDEVAKSK
jgi:DNA-binding transcriptional LysR family regulator